MDYIYAYVKAVGRKLPARLQEDVEKELHSLIIDALEEGNPGADGSWTEEEQITVLREFGPPAAMAAQYASPRRYLVGPKLFPIFRIAALAVIGALLLSTLVAYFASMEPLPGGGFDWAALFLALLEGLFASIVSGLGSVTLVFAILERVLPEHVLLSLQEDDWQPEMLEEPEEEEKVQVVPLVLGIVFLALCLVVFNIFPEKVGYYSYLSTEGFNGWVSVPALADAFFTRYLPLINIYWIFTMLLAVSLLILRGWNRVLQVVDFAISVLGLVIVVRFINGPSIFGLGSNPEFTPDLLEVYGIVNGIFTVMWEIGLVFILAGAVFASIRNLLRIFDIHNLDDFKRAFASVRQ